jgi:hypothetical protein
MEIDDDRLDLRVIFERLKVDISVDVKLSKRHGTTAQAVIPTDTVASVKYLGYLGYTEITTPQSSKSVLLNTTQLLSTTQTVEDLCTCCNQCQEAGSLCAYFWMLSGVPIFNIIATTNASLCPPIARIALKHGLELLRTVLVDAGRGSIRTG